jgi:hypothetical protein
MPEYQLFHVERANIRAEKITAPSDTEAIKQAARLVDGETAELWRDWTRVKTFKRGS